MRGRRGSVDVVFGRDLVLGAGACRRRHDLHPPGGRAARRLGGGRCTLGRYESLGDRVRDDKAEADAGESRGRRGAHVFADGAGLGELPDEEGRAFTEVSIDVGYKGDK